jgi:hypothetical protein
MRQCFHGGEHLDCGILSIVGGYECLGGTYCLDLQDRHEDGCDSFLQDDGNNLKEGVIIHKTIVHGIIPSDLEQNFYCYHTLKQRQ